MGTLVSPGSPWHACLAGKAWGPTQPAFSPEVTHTPLGHLTLMPAWVSQLHASLWWMIGHEAQHIGCVHTLFAMGASNNSTSDAYTCPRHMPGLGGVSSDGVLAAGHAQWFPRDRDSLLLGCHYWAHPGTCSLEPSCPSSRTPNATWPADTTSCIRETPGGVV